VPLEETPAAAKRAKDPSGGAAKKTPPTKRTPTKKTPAKKEPPKEPPRPPGHPIAESDLKFTIISEVQQWGAGDNREAPPNKGSKEAPRGGAVHV
jgi:hypothetical protein